MGTGSSGNYGNTKGAQTMPNHAQAVTPAESLFGILWITQIRMLRVKRRLMKRVWDTTNQIITVWSVKSIMPLPQEQQSHTKSLLRNMAPNTSTAFL